MSYRPLAASGKDHIYSARQEKVDDFVFDEEVADVFADMIGRSVPGYHALNLLIPILADKFIRTGSNCYDLGCSLGEASLLVAENTRYTDVQVIAIDSSPAMIDRLKKRLVKLDTSIPVIPLCCDVMDADIQNASFVILNFTLQFICQDQRDDLIVKLRSGLNRGGALLLSEKITHEDVDEEEFMRVLHEEYKRENNYSDLEISQKREALERVLIRDTHDQHVSRLQAAGFSKVYVLAKYLNFVSYVAVR